MADKVAKKLGAKRAPDARGDSNERVIQGKLIVIRSAKIDTKRVQVSDAMLKRVHYIVGVFETPTGAYAIRRLTAAKFKKHMRVAASREQGNVVSRVVFMNAGDDLGMIKAGV